MRNNKLLPLPQISLKLEMVKDQTLFNYHDTQNIDFPNATTVWVGK